MVVNDLDAAAASDIAAEIVAAGGRATAVASDIAAESGATATVDAAVEAYGRVDIVVNNAGLLRSAPFTEVTADLWDRVIAVNLRGTFLVTHAAWQHFVELGTHPQPGAGGRRSGHPRQRRRADGLHGDVGCVEDRAGGVEDG